MVKMRKRRCGTKNTVVIILTAIVVFTLGYHLAVFCVLDKMDDDPAIRNLHNIRQLETDTPLTTRDSVDTFRGLHAKMVHQEFAGFRPNDISELSANNKILNTVHYVWCHERPFDFTTYLSILSVWKILQPDIIEFHLVVPNVTDDKYNDWRAEVKRMIPGFVEKRVPKNWDGDEHGCGLWFGLAVIDDRGGMYIGNNVIVTDAILSYRISDFSILALRNHDNASSVAVAMTTEHNAKFRLQKQQFGAKGTFPEHHNVCGVISRKYNGNMSLPCYNFEGSANPADFFTLDTQFGAFVRKLVYNNEALIKPRPFLPGFIPKIVHYVWFGAKEMDFLMYLSMLSTLFIVNAEKVFIHWDGGLRGKYFDRVLKDKRIVLVMRERPFHIYGHQVLYSQHRSDVVRAECLLKYGGIYMDWDVLWLRNPDDVIQTGYDTIANFDHMAQGLFPNTINLGVLMAKPRSTFIKRWQDALINYRSKDFLYNAVELPYKIYERYPEYIYIERRLQVMCFHLKCHPTFHHDFKNYIEEQPFNWSTDVYAIHFTHPDPPELMNESALASASGRFADMGKFIFQHSVKLDKR